LGVLWIAHLSPFKRSASVTVAPPLVKSLDRYPAAVQAVLDVHDTPPNWLFVAPAGLRVLWIAQLSPFRRSANVTVVPGLMVKDPTAVHAVVDAHDTPPNLLSVASTGLEVLWTDQLAPFDRSASVARVVPLMNVPTAVHAVADVHDTPLSALKLRAGVSWIVQLTPFQRSASVSRPKSSSKKLPTAVHAVVDVQDTPLSWTFTAPGGAAVSWIAQLTPFQRSANVP
jgi:hypothetical protein